MKKRVIVAVVIAAVVTLVLDFAVELTASSLQPFLVGKEWLLYVILTVAFLITLGLSLYITRQEGLEETPALKIEQSASTNSTIKDSPIVAHKDSQATVRQTAENRGTIEGSGITIE